MTKRRLFTAGTVAVLAAAVLLFGGVFRDGGRAQPPAASAAGGDGLAAAGMRFQQRYRETADASYLVRAATAFRRAPRDAVAVGGLASVELSRHRFRNALALAREAGKLDPKGWYPSALLGDALVELGRYDQAFAAFDRATARKPGLVTYSRVAYGRELLGDRAGAIAAMRLALDAASPRSEAAAWAHVELGKLFFGQGNVAVAAREYHAALDAFPGYVYALDQLARVEAARGRTADAIELSKSVVERVPLPQFVTTLGDLYRLEGRRDLARAQYATIGAIERLLAASGVRTDLETALFDADHGHGSVALARRAQRDRPSVEGADVLAWTLARAGRCAEARTWSERALRLGTRDALKFFHRAWIEDCLGARAVARTWARRALALNPHFSLLWAAEAGSLAR